MTPTPDCPDCNGSGYVLKDTSHLGEASGWNPGAVKIRCQCNPISEEDWKKLQAELEALIKRELE